GPRTLSSRLQRFRPLQEKPAESVRNCVRGEKARGRDENRGQRGPRRTPADGPLWLRSAGPGPDGSRQSRERNEDAGLVGGEIDRVVQEERRHAHGWGSRR